MPRLRITFAGNVVVEVDGRRLSGDVLGPRGRIVLACLVLERQRLVPADELADVTWGMDLPPTWRPALRGIVTRVRRFLELPRLDGAITLESRQGCYQLTLPDDAEVDVERAVIDHNAARAALDAGNHVRAISLAQQSVGVCRQEFLPGAGGEWVEAQQLRLRNLYLAAHEILSEAAIAGREWDVARHAAEDVLAREAYRESAYVLLMRAHAGAGNVTEAMLTYKRCCDVLERELGTEPGRTTREAFLTLARTNGTEVAEEGREATNLPVGISTFVGRTERLVTLRSRITSHRLITLTGTAGVGKSRLAVEATRPLTSTFAGGVWLVELAEVSAGVARHAATVLRLPDAPGCDAIDSLCGHIASKDMLLVLDNCEHVLAETAGVVGRLLAACPKLRILATSREPLHLGGELIWPVEPLSLPPAVGGDDVFASEAVQLFADRASSARPGLDIDDDAVAEVCRRLDGIPLGIELAAAHVRAFSVRELATLLADQPQLVTRSPARGDAGRHASLAAALDWSYGLLDAGERAVLRRLSVFAGGFIAEAAESVCADMRLDIVGALANLVDKSLVAARHGSPTRFRLLETVRAHATAKLAATGEEGDVRSRHLDWVYALARTSAEATALERLDAEQGNIRAALQWSVDSSQEERGLQLAIALTRYWEVRGYLGEGRSWLEQLARSDAAGQDARAAALSAAGVLANHQSDFAAAREMHSEALIIRRSVGEPRAIAATLNGLATVAVSAGDYPAARPIFEEILDIGRRLPDRQVIAACLVNLAAVTLHALEETVEWPYALGDAREWLLEASTILREMGDVRGVAQASENLGVVSAMDRHYDRARSYFRQCLDLYRQLGDKKGVAGTVRFLGQLSYRDGDYGRASELLDECLALERELGSTQRVAEALGFLGAIAHSAGRAGEARRCYRESLAAYAEAGNPAGADDVLRRLLDLDDAVAPINRGG